MLLSYDCTLTLAVACRCMVTAISSRNIFLKDTNKLVSSAVLKNPRITEGEVLAVARAGAAAGCAEALFTLGDKPELRYRVARDELAARVAHLQADRRLGQVEAPGRGGDGVAAVIPPRIDSASPVYRSLEERR